MARPPDSDDALALVRDEWLRRVEAEYRSAALTQHLVLWLIQLGCSPDLVRDGLRIVDDELVHAEMSHAVYAAAGGDGAPAIDRAGLALARSDAPLEDDVLRVGVRIFCLGETVAVPLFRHLREAAEEPSARQALDRILVDEVRHRDFGWTLLEWLLEAGDADAVRAQVSAELPGMLADLEHSYGDEAAARAADACPPEARRWGLAPASEYARVLARCRERDYRPRFDRLGIALP